MSQSRKKIPCDQIPMMSVTQKLRHTAVQALYKKRCCQKENLNESKQRKQSKPKEGNSSSKKMKRKKFLEEEVQKLLQKRYTNEQMKINQIKSQNASEFQVLKVDLKQMKDVLNKLSFEEKKNIKQDTMKNQEDDKEQFSSLCTSYQRKIDDLRTELEIQKQINLKLEEGHIQSQLLAKQTKDYCQSINKQLLELAQKHLKCDLNAKQLDSIRRIVKVLQSQKKQLNDNLAFEKFQKNKMQQKLKVQIQILEQKIKQMKLNTSNYTNLEIKYKQSQKLIQKYEQENQELNQKFDQCHQEYEKSIERLKQKILNQAQKHKNQINDINQLDLIEKAEIQSNMSKLKQQIQLSEKRMNEAQKEKQTYKNNLKIIQGQLTTEKQRVFELACKNDLLIELKNKIQSDLKKIQTQFNNAKQDLGNTKQKLGSLSSMEKKCQELYMEIKLQKDRCANFNLQTAKQRQNLQNRVKQLEKEQENYELNIQKIQAQKQELKELFQLQKIQSKILLQDKIKITKKIKEFEQKISAMQLNKVQVIKQNETIMNRLVILRSEMEQKQKNWLNEKQKYQMRQLWLEKQKRQIQSEVKATLQAIKKRNNQIQTLNQNNEEQINMLKEEKLRLQENLVKVNNQNENMKIALSTKQSKINQLQQAQNQNESILKIIKDKLIQMQFSSKSLNKQWEDRYKSLQNKYHKLQRQAKCYEVELEQQKQKCKNNQRQLNQKDNKIQNLSTIRQSLQVKLEDIQQRLHQTETIRLSLSSQLQSQMQTRRNQQILEEQKALLQNELKLKNKNISQLKQTIKIVRDESLQIKEQVAEYNKLMNLEQLFGKQMKSIQENLNYLKREKEQLQLLINILKSQNNQLSNKIYAIENDDLQWPQRENRFKNTILHLQNELEEVNNHKNKIIQELNNQREQIKNFNISLQQQRSQTSIKILQSETTINTTKLNLDGESQKCQKLSELLKQKDNIIKQQAKKLKLYEEKKIKVINQVHSIQNQISQIGFKNDQLEQEKAELQENLGKKEQQISLLSQKISILLENNSALEVQKVAFNEHQSLLRKQIKQLNDKLIIAGQNSQKTVNQIYEICEARKNQAVNVLKQKIKQLATELSNCVNKLNNKNRDLEKLQQKFINLQSSINENNELLEKQRKQRQRVSLAQNQSMIQIDNLKIVASSKQKDNQTLIRDKTILREKLIQQQSKYEILKRKYEFLEHDLSCIQKQKENQNIQLRVLKEENKNIEKVMTEQMNQRKGIIQQLVGEKRMLYAQLNQQR